MEYHLFDYTYFITEGKVNVSLRKELGNISKVGLDPRSVSLSNTKDLRLYALSLSETWNQRLETLKNRWDPRPRLLVRPKTQEPRHCCKTRPETWDPSLLKFGWEERPNTVCTWYLGYKTLEI